MSSPTGQSQPIAPVEAPIVKPSPWRPWVEFLGLFIIYEGFETARDHAVGMRGPAIEHARWVVDIERWTWTLHEHRLNVSVTHHKSLAQAMNIYYGTIHFLIPPAILIWLWRRHPDRYRRWRNILAALTFVSLLFFWQFPVAPPRLYTGVLPVTNSQTCQEAIAADVPHLHFVDTDACYGGLGPLDRGKFKDHNPYAAMPSLHMAWSTWCACAVIGALGAGTAWPRRCRWLALLYPCWTLTVVVGTANHWVLDAVGGWIFLAGAWWAVSRCMARPNTGTGRARRLPASLQRLRQ